MIVHDIAHWLARLDISHVDMRVRIPALLLPLLLLCLLFAQFMAMRSISNSGAALSEVNLVVQELSQAQKSENQAQPVNGASSINPGLNELHALSLTLQGFLAKGNNTQTFSQIAAVLSDLTEPAKTITLPTVDFWQRFSQQLAQLEDAVRTNSLVIPEAQAIVEQIRTKYGQLRSTDIAPLPTGVAANGTGAAEASIVGVDEISQIEQALWKARFWQFVSLFVGLCATLLFAVLIWGVWKSYQFSKTSISSKNVREQEAILKLLDEITPLAEGDLRVRATVSEAATGAVADAFNYAVAELRRLVMAVKESADMVKVSVSETRESAQQLAQASTVQAREIHRSSNYLNVMSDTMAQLSANAVDSSSIADTSLKQAQKGNEAVQATVDGLQKIRAQADMTTRLMDRLHDSSQSIASMVADIQSVAKRSDLLALNTTIRAAAVVNGTDSSTDLSHLCDEVSHLSDVLGRVTQEIARETNTIEQDTQLVRESMAQTNSELDVGLNTADQANVALQAIERVSNDLHVLVSDIASKSLRQSGVVKQLSANMGVINNITKDSAVGLQNSAKALDELQRITTELRDSVADFQLPYQAASSRLKQSTGHKSNAAETTARRPVRDHTHG